MKLRAVSLAAIAATASALVAAEPALEFSGVLTADGKTRIALTDRNNNTTTWVEPGETIPGGYVLDRYDPKEEAIFLKKSGQETRLGLVPAKTPETPSGPRAAVPSNIAAARPAPAVPPSPTAPASTAPAPSPPPIVPPTTPATPSAPIASTTSPAAATVNPAPTPNDPAAASSTAANSAVPPSPNDPATTAANPGGAPASGVNPNPAATTPAPDAYAGTPPAAATTAAADPTPTGRPTSRANYIIQGGDTLDGIALTHGVSVQQLRQLNPSLNSNSLRAGETLRIR